MLIPAIHKLKQSAPMTFSSTKLLISSLMLFCSIKNINTQIYRNMTGLAGVHSVAYVTVPTEEVAKSLARSLVEKKLAACVNILPGIISIYEWENKVTEDNELLLMIKTRTDTVDALTKFVRENHPYQVCEVISIPIQNGNSKYLEWISNVVPPISNKNSEFSGESRPLGE